MTDVIDRIFDRATGTLPVFVPQTPAIIAGAAVGLLVFYEGQKSINADRIKMREDDDPLKRYRWVVMLGVLVAVSTRLGRVVQEMIFFVSNLKKNRQHFVNMMWLQMYAKSLRAPSSFI